VDARTTKIIGILNREYPNPRPFLNFETPFQLLVATILSAQCTDERVNIVTKELFKVGGTPEQLLALGPRKVMALIRTTGFFNAKTKSLLGAAHAILEEYGGEVPNNLESLQKLPGVGRKTASVVLTQAFGVPAFPVDRHVHRVALRLDLTRATTADKADLDLRRAIDKKYWISTHIQMISHGRKICKPKPRCSECPLLDYCPFGKAQQKILAAKKFSKEKFVEKR